MPERTNANASHTARALLRPLVRFTHWLGPMNLDRRNPAANAFQGTINLALTGQQPSDWRLQLREGRLGVHEGLAEDARATVTVDDAHFGQMLSGQLGVPTAQMTGKIRLRGDGEMAFVVGGIVTAFARMRQAQGWRGWPLRRYSEYVLREIPSAPANERTA